jgi:hypothetical protein
MVAVSFIVGGNRRTRRKTPTCKTRHNIIGIAIEKVLLQYWTEDNPKYSQENTNNKYQGKT